MTKIALFQSCTGVDPEANADRLVEAVEGAASGGAEMLFTPEMSGFLDRDRQRAATTIRPEEDDRVLAACRDAAKANALWVHLGSLAIKTESGKYANRAFVIDPEGKIRARYDKMHLFDVDLPSGESWRESAVYQAGADSIVVDRTPVGRLGLAICYDVRFPALFERLSEAGAQLISVPAAITVPTGKAHWEVLLRARAIEAGVFVVAAAQGGRHEDGRETYGHSLVVDPWGEILLDLRERNGLGFAEVDIARVEDVRQRVPAMSHRRPIPEATLL
jgi:predicted amidohydrolase